MAILIDGTKGIFGVPAVYEKSVTSATAATGTVDFDILNQSLLQYTTNASGNWTINFRGNSSTTLNSLLPVGQSVTAVFLAKQGTTPYYNAEIKIDGAVIVPNWQGGSAPTAGTANGFDAYTYLIIKTGNATFSVYASLTNYASYVPPLADAYFNLTTLLLHGDGTNGAQNNTFLDSSTNNFTITRNGNATQGTFTPFSQTGWSNYFDGSGDYLLTNITGKTLGTGSFTVECFFYVNALTSGYIVLSSTRTGGGSDGTSFTINNANQKVTITTSGSVLYTGTTTINLNQWYHIAYVRNGSSACSVYVNGALDGTFTDSRNFSGTQVLIGGGEGGNAELNGYISNYRITNIAVYTSTFTPPTSPLTSAYSLLACQSNRFVDNSGNNFAFTIGGSPSVQAFSPFAPTAAYSAATVGGSAYFDGSGDYLSYPDNAAFQFGTGDFTVEAWVYPRATPAVNYTHIVGSQEFGLNGTWLLGIDSNLNLRIFASALNGTGGTNAAGGTIPLNAWSYVAMVRSGSTLKGYINGVEVCSTANSANINSAGYAGSIGADTNGDEAAFNGYISNVRVVNGGALTVTSVPSSPLTATAASGTVSLLTNFTNAGIIDQTGKNDLETVGNAQISTAVKKYGTGSLAFDGTGDNLTLVNKTSRPIYFGSGNWTVEFWAYHNTTGTYDHTFIGGTSFYDVIFGIFNNGSQIGFWNNNTFYGLYASSNLTSGVWRHIAYVRNGNTITLYINGTSVGSTAFTGGMKEDGSNDFLTTVVGSSMNGYLDDVRVTKGFARYTANFTPPAAAFADQ